jgi:LmbE family N-acetylglucosaminyl deacetylase
MKFHQPQSDLFIPDGLPPEQALARTTHLGIGAHQDDLEFMAFHGIVAGVTRPDQWFSGVTCTNGAGSARSGAFAHFTDEEMQAVRRDEQREAARIGHYAAMIQLNYPSAAFKSPPPPEPEEDILTILRAARPQVVYTHNPADKHATHIGVLNTTLRALRRLPPEERPEQLLGCEVWRDLDWLCDVDKTLLDVSGHDDLAEKLNAVFASQIAGGKRYDLAIQGRRRANATFFNAHCVDGCESVCFALDLTPLLRDDTLSLAEFITPFLNRFQDAVLNALPS